MTTDTANAIEWSRAKLDAEWLAGSTADTAERNLGRAFLALCTELDHLQRTIADGLRSSRGRND